MTIWENLLILKNKERVMNFGIPSCDVFNEEVRDKANRGRENDNSASYRR